MLMNKTPSKLLILCASAFFALAGCVTQGAPQVNVTPTGPAPNDGLNAALWMQQAVEYKATVDSVYALGHLRLAEALADKSWTALPELQDSDCYMKPPAIILDADETVLDNSAYQAMLVKTGTSFTEESWNDFVNDASALAMPAALEFTKAAAAKGVTIFYVTNRSVDVEDGTIRNLRALGFPMKDGVDTVMSKENTSKKSARREAVAANYRVLLLFGDNFGDFTDDYKGTPAERQAVYESNAAHWGRDWLMLPNPSYGSWETTAFGEDYSLSDEEKRQRKLDHLRIWKP